MMAHCTSRRRTGLEPSWMIGARAFVRLLGRPMPAGDDVFFA